MDSATPSSPRRLDTVLGYASTYSIPIALFMLSLLCIFEARLLGNHVELTGRVIEVLGRAQREQSDFDKESMGINRQVVDLVGKVVTVLESHNDTIVAIQGGDKDAAKLAELLREERQSQRELKDKAVAVQAEAGQLVAHSAEALNVARKDLEDRVWSRVDSESSKLLTWAQIVTAIVIALAIGQPLVRKAAQRRGQRQS